MASERRTTKRIPAYFAVELNSTAKRGRCGVTRNASDQGLLIVTPSRFAENDPIELAVHADGMEAKVAGRIVRIAVNSMTSNEMWRYSLAVELDEPLPTALLERASSSPFLAAARAS